MRHTIGRVVVPAVSGGLGALLVFGVLQVVTADADATAAGAIVSSPRRAAQPDPFASFDPWASATPAPTATPTRSATPTPSATPEPTPTTKARKPAAQDDGRLARTGTGGQFVSLTAHTRQRVEPDTWTQLAFDGEQSDRLGWHAPGSPVIVPARTAVALVCYKVTWTEDVRPTQYLAQIARDPDGAIDVTGAENAINAPGRDYRALCWSMKVRAGQPLAIRVKHDGSRATAVVFAEFKIWIP